MTFLLARGAKNVPAEVQRWQYFLLRKGYNQTGGIDAEYLVHCRSRHWNDGFEAIVPGPKDEAFFLSSRGCRLSAAGNLAKARKLAGLDDGKPLRPHDLRHRFAVTRLGLWHQ